MVGQVGTGFALLVYRYYIEHRDEMSRWHSGNEVAKSDSDSIDLLPVGPGRIWPYCMMNGISGFGKIELKKPRVHLSP